MRRYVFPLLVFTAIGAIFVVWWRSRDTITPRPLEKTEKNREQEVDRRKDTGFKPAKTRTSIDDDRWLRELERALGRKDLSRALQFRQKVCENLDTLLKNEKLTRNLLDLIKENADSDDLRRRDVVIPMLRVVAHPEATDLIEELYYTAKNDDERITLLNAMAREHHDASRAREWMVERALNSTEKKHREAAGYVVYHYVTDDKLMVDVAGQIYSSTLDSVQANRMIEAISTRAPTSAEAVGFLRKRLANPRGNELDVVTELITQWGKDEDADRLVQLAREFPRKAHTLLHTAVTIRAEQRSRRMAKAAHDRGESYDPSTVDRERQKEHERLEKEQREREEAAKAANGG